MIPQIGKALANGFTSKQVVDFILRKFPEHADKIRSAMAAGFTVDQVVKFIGEGRKGVSRENQPTTEHEQTRRTDIGRRENVNKGALAAGALALAPLAAPMVQQAIQRAIPTSLQGIAQQTLQLPQTNQQTQQPPLVDINTSEPSIQQNAPIPQPEVKSINVKDILSKEGTSNKIDELMASGNGPKEVTGYFQKFHPNVVKSIEKESGMPFEKVVEQYQSENPKQKELKVEEVIETEKPTISKMETVATPHGVGEVKEIRNGKAIVEVDGKLHKVSEEDLEKEPEDIADLYDNLFEAIPDQYKSRMMNYAGYDEEANELLFRPHGGGAYVYKDIPPEFAEELKNRLHRAKTTGQNMYGMWNEGDQSYGAGMSALIKKLQAQYGGKGKEYVRKYNTLFDILGVPHEAKKRKEEEKRRKRKGLS